MYDTIDTIASNLENTLGRGVYATTAVLDSDWCIVLEGTGESRGDGVHNGAWAYLAEDIGEWIARYDQGDVDKGEAYQDLCDTLDPVQTPEAAKDAILQCDLALCVTGVCVPVLGSCKIVATEHVITQDPAITSPIEVQVYSNRGDCCAIYYDGTAVWYDSLDSLATEHTWVAVPTIE